MEGTNIDIADVKSILSTFSTTPDPPADSPNNDEPEDDPEPTDQPTDRPTNRPTLSKKISQRSTYSTNVRISSSSTQTSVPSCGPRTTNACEVLCDADSQTFTGEPSRIRNCSTICHATTIGCSESIGISTSIEVAAACRLVTWSTNTALATEAPLVPTGLPASIVSIISLGAISAASEDLVIGIPSMFALPPIFGRTKTHYPQALSTTSSATSDGTTSNSTQPVRTTSSENLSITTRTPGHHVRTSTQQSNAPNGQMSGPTPGPLPLAPVAIPPLSDSNAAPSSTVLPVSPSATALCGVWPGGKELAKSEAVPLDDTQTILTQIQVFCNPWENGMPDGNIVIPNQKATEVFQNIAYAF